MLNGAAARARNRQDPVALSPADGWATSPALSTDASVAVSVALSPARSTPPSVAGGASVCPTPASACATPSQVMVMSEFSPPKPSGAVAGLAGSAIQLGPPPSAGASLDVTTNL